MARLYVNYAENNGIKNELEFRNFFFFLILEEFVLVNKKYFFDVRKLKNKIKDFNTEYKYAFIFRNKYNRIGQRQKLRLRFFQN
jgi:hypothetical protein